MLFTRKKPTEAGFYYYQNDALRAISPKAVAIVQVSKYANKGGFSCTALVPANQQHHLPVFSEKPLDEINDGWWAGKLPEPHF